MIGGTLIGCTLRVPVAAILLGSAAIGAATASDPQLPPGRPPTGPMVAIVGGGLDHTRRDIAAAIARDGEGVPVSWDFIDDDPLAFAKVTPDTELAAQMIADGAVAIVAVRENTQTPGGFGQAMGFVMHTPARLIIATGLTPDRPDWRLLRLMADHLTGRILIVPPGPDPQAEPRAQARRKPAPEPGSASPGSAAATPDNRAAQRLGPIVRVGALRPDIDKDNGRHTADLYIDVAGAEADTDTKMTADQHAQLALARMVLRLARTHPNKSGFVLLSRIGATARRLADGRRQLEAADRLAPSGAQRH